MFIHLTCEHFGGGQIHQGPRRAPVPTHSNHLWSTKEGKAKRRVMKINSRGHSLTSLSGDSSLQSLSTLWADQLGPHSLLLLGPCSCVWHGLEWGEGKSHSHLVQLNQLGLKWGCVWVWGACVPLYQCQNCSAGDDILSSGDSLLSLFDRNGPNAIPFGHF